MAPDRWSPTLSTPEVVSVVVLGAAVALPLALVGLSTVTGWDAGSGRGPGLYWGVLGVLAVGSLLAVPYGVTLGVVTLPVAARTGVGYGPPAESGGVAPRIQHVAGAVLYAGLTTFAGGLVLSTTIWRAGLSTTLDTLDPALGATALLAGGLLVAATFLAGQLHQHAGRDVAVEDGTILVYSLFATGLLPSPFAALLLADWLFPAVDLLGVVLLHPW